MRSRRGFTLIELMVVIAIVAGLAAYVGYRYTHASAVGNAGNVQIELAQIAGAVDAYKSDVGSYPGTYNAYAQVNPSLFGGANNKYFNGYPTDAGQVYMYVLGYATNNTATFLVYDMNPYDGVSLQNVKCTDGSVPLPGRVYRIGYDTLYGGIFALGPY